MTAIHPFRLLYVSAIDVYKHPWHVAEAVAELRKTGVPARLDIVGPIQRLARSRWNDAIERLDSKREFLFAHGAMPYDQMAAIYREAELFVYASTCETFGNTLLEAMAAGLPVACSNRSAMPEVLGGAGIYFDPEKPAEILNALIRLVESKEERESLAEKAYHRALEFSWEKCAESTLAFLNAASSRRTDQGSTISA
jgi:glycosyltransferase involved in cell wall biosynthesis